MQLLCLSRAGSATPARAAITVRQIIRCFLGAELGIGIRSITQAALKQLGGMDRATHQTGAGR